MPLVTFAGVTLNEEPLHSEGVMAEITGVGLTTILTEVEVAGEPAKQGVAFEVITHVTASLFANVVEVNVAAFVPALVPLTFHWYEGVVPPLVGVAVNVTEVPEQIVVAVAAIDTLAVRIGLTVTVAFALKFCEQVVVEFVTETNVNV